MRVREASGCDVAFVAALLARGGIAVDTRSIERRIEDGKGGMLFTDRATVSWTLEGASLHLYDLAGESADVAALLERAVEIGRTHDATLLVADLYSDDPLTEVLVRTGFTPAWREDEPVKGQLRTMVTFTRITQ